VLAGYVIIQLAGQYIELYDSSVYKLGWHVAANLWDYLRWLALPTGGTEGDGVRYAAAAAIIGLCLMLRARLPMFALLWLVIATLPFSFFETGIEFRYLYLPAAPLSLLLISLATELAERLPLRLTPTAPLAVLAIAVLLLAPRARERQDWISEQAAQYEALFHGVPGVCGPLREGSDIYVVGSPLFDLFGISSEIALNLVYEEVNVQRVSEEPAETMGCVAVYEAGRYVNRAP
jgi:hypothetical protein